MSMICLFLVIKSIRLICLCRRTLPMRNLRIWSSRILLPLVREESMIRFGDWRSARLINNYLGFFCLVIVPIISLTGVVLFILKQSTDFRSRTSKSTTKNTSFLSGTRHLRSFSMDLISPMVSWERLELSTPGLKGPCSNQLSYQPTFVVISAGVEPALTGWKPVVLTVILRDLTCIISKTETKSNDFIKNFD